MKKVLSVALVAVLALALAPVSAGGFHGGGGRGGGRGGFHHGGFHHGGFTRFGCCFALASSVGSSLARRSPTRTMPIPTYGYPYLWLSLRGVPGLSGPGLRTSAGLPAADAGLCGSLSPAASLLPQRLLLPVRRWGDRRLFLEMGASGAGRAPGAHRSARPLKKTRGAVPISERVATTIAPSAPTRARPRGVVSPTGRPLAGRIPTRPVLERPTRDRGV
jgi:hypothetical protein